MTGPSAAGESLPSLRATVERLLLPLLVHRLLLLAVVLASMGLWPGFFNTGAFYGNFHWPADALVGPTSYFSTWDAQHYLFISRFGYGPLPDSGLFFPLWPLLVRAAAPLAGGDALAAAVVLANALSTAGLLAFHWAAERAHGRRAADAALLLLAAFPGTVFFCVPYSEALFFLLAVLAVAGLEASAPLYAAAAFLLPMTRPVGILILAPALHSVLAERRARPGHWGRGLWKLMVPLYGYAAYLCLMGVLAGDPFVHFRLNAGRTLLVQATVAKLWDLPGFLAALARVGSLHGMLDSALDRLWFLLLLPGLAWLWKRERTAFWYALPMALVPAMTFSFWGFTRYAAVVFPAFAAAGAVLSGPGRRRWLAAAAGALFTVQLWFLLRHVNSYWVG